MADSNESAAFVTYRDYDPKAAEEAAKAAKVADKTPVKATDAKKEN